MNIKIDTKEKFTVITPEQESFTAMLSEKLVEILKQRKQSNPPHVILNLNQITSAESDAVDTIIQIQHEFYNDNLSFVICGIEKKLLPIFEESSNITPTESEAWDILQMEEIERELMSGD